MKRQQLIWAAAGTAILGLPSIGLAQSSTREPGGEFGIDVLYQLSNTTDFDGGSRIKMDDDIGASLNFGWRFNPKWELQFILDWAKTNYHGTLQSASFPGLSADVRGDMESFAFRINGIWNLLEGPLTPFVSAGIGYAWIDTNIPTGQVQVGCWWDPWWGQICTPYQPTKSVDSFTYQAGLGARWDITDYFTMRFTWEHQWFDISHASGTPGWDQVKVGAIWRY
ncbi:MAG TPA: outer membrane beta-barrel protein [Steroidobacteraceae bacterium]|jgi:opacity protein-like surface antigen|nr:outer membrane beta-barrel protein [Steroidobacteraceae bacterium]